MELNEEELANSLSESLESAIRKARYKKGFVGRDLKKLLKGVVIETVRDKRKKGGYVSAKDREKDVLPRGGTKLWHLRKEASDRTLGVSVKTVTYLPRQLTAENRFQVAGLNELSPAYIKNVLGPFLTAVESLQQVFLEMGHKKRRSVLVRYITQQSAVEIGLDGAAEVIDTLKEELVPWRRKNAKKIAELKQREIETDIKKKEAEATHVRAQSAKTKAEANKLAAEIERMRAEARRQELENEKLRFEIEQAKLSLAMELAGKINPDLPEKERVLYAIRMLPSLSVLGTSEVELRALSPAPVVADQKEEKI